MLRPYVLRGHNVDSCRRTGPSSNGRTPDFGSGYGGSNPPGPIPFSAPPSPAGGAPMAVRVIRTTALLALLTPPLAAQTPQTGFPDRPVSVAGQPHPYQ